jgi:hypothetical protein
MDFYMGLMLSSDYEAWNVPLRLLYGHFFERLKRRGCTWRYASPGIYLLRIKDDADAPDPASYDPASAVQKALEEEEGAESDDAADELARRLAQENEAAYRRHVEQPPRIVLAYRNVYGEMPPYTRPGT